MKPELIKRISDNVCIRRDEWDQYIVEVKDNPDANYHTDCKQDALDTATAIESECQSTEPVIVKATIHRSMYSTWITVELSNRTKTKLFDYFRDEISFSPREFIGKTKADALKLKFNRDRNYLR